MIRADERVKERANAALKIADSTGKTTSSPIDGDRSMFPAPKHTLDSLLCPLVKEVLRSMGYHLTHLHVVRTTGVGRQVSHRDFSWDDLSDQPGVSSGMPLSVIQSLQDRGTLPVFLNTSTDKDEVNLRNSHYVSLDQGDIVVFDGLLQHFWNSCTLCHTRVHSYGKRLDTVAQGGTTYKDVPNLSVIQRLREVHR